MFHTISEINKCLYSPYLILIIAFCSHLFITQKKERLIVLITVFFTLAWRSIANISSSRYCSIFLILFFILLSFFIKNTRNSFKKKHLLVLFLFVVVNFVFCFSSFRNTFILTLKDSISRSLAKDKKTTFFIDKKDYYRIRNPQQKSNQIELLSPPSNYCDFDYLYTLYNFWESNAFYLIHEKKDALKQNHNTMECMYNNKACYRKIGQLIANKSKTNVYSIYSHNRFYPSSYEKLARSDNPTIKDIISNGILKSAYPRFDVYIYQLKCQLYWLIGKDIEANTEIIYHIHTNKVDLLPPKRIEYGFDNRGFRPSHTKPVEQWEGYVIYEKPLPQVPYPITQIRVGFNSGKAVWFNSFTPSK